MRMHCTLTLGGILPEQAMPVLAQAICDQRPWSPKGKATTEWVLSCMQQEQSPSWEFEGIQDGKMAKPLEDLLKSLTLDWSWQINNTDDWQITIHTHMANGNTDVFLYHSEENQICLPVNALSCERITAAKNWQHWLDTLTLKISKSAHETLNLLAVDS